MLNELTVNSYGRKLSIGANSLGPDQSLKKTNIKTSFKHVPNWNIAEDVVSEALGA